MPNQAPTALALNNQVTSINENSSTTVRIKVADVVVTDDGIGTNNFTVTGADAAFFEADSNGLYIKAGTILDFETKSSYAVTVNVDDAGVGATPDASASFNLSVTDIVNENPSQPVLYVSEVAPWSSGNSPVANDWFELTNSGSSAIDITGWKMDDNSNAFATAVALHGVTSIAPGESVIFIETATVGDLAAKTATFLNTWFGSAPPAGLRIGGYTGSGVGLSTAGDAVNIYNAAGVLQTNVSLGTSPTGPSFATFNNANGLNNALISDLSAVGLNGGFKAVNDANEIGSPGSVGKLFISEVAPWSSGNSPVALRADWFEVTNTKAVAVDITGWKMDDNSGSFAASVPLGGITSIAPGESVIFIETATAGDLPAKAAAFLQTWFGNNPPANLRIGSYTGTGVGLSTAGDAVNLYDASGMLQTSVSFGASPTGTFATFDNAAGLNGVVISQLSSAGVNAAFVATTDATEIGSPGEIVPVNDAPDAVDDSLSAIDEDSGNRVISFASLLANDKAGPANESGQTLTITSVGNAVGGTVSIVGTDVIFAPSLDFNGAASFTYTVQDNGTSYGVNKFLTDTATANFTVNPVAENFTLQILHMYGESGLLAIDTAPKAGALIDKFDDQYVNTLVVTEGDLTIPGPFLIGGADPSLNSVPGIGTTALGRPDVAIMNAMGVDAAALGNHEFDLGSPAFQAAIAPAGAGPTAWVGAQFPFITDNLSFAGDSSLKPLADTSLGGTATTAGAEASTIKGKIAPRSIVTMNGEKVGIVGLTTWNLLEKTSPNGTVVKTDADPLTDQLHEAAAFVQAQVDALKAAGVNKIIMLDQLDTITRNQALAPLVSGIDVMVAGGGHERLGDVNDTAVAFNGHDATFENTYPIVLSGADGKPVLLVTTDTEYSYVGRLVVDFDPNGEIIVGNLNNTINGAYAANNATLEAVYNNGQTGAQIVAGSTIGSAVKAITDAINTVVVSKDSNVFGFTNVYLEGDRVFGRAQETNLGDISADANIRVANIALANSTPYVFSLKNGGGLRSSVGSIDEDGLKVAPLANTVTGKPNGGVSQLDVENALRFDNKLMVFDTTPQGLLNIFNYAAGLAPGNGGFPQIGGLRFSYDPTKPAGQKVQSIALTDINEKVIAHVVENGVVVAGAPATISAVILNFTANGGDGYPIKTNGTNFRYLLANGTVSTAVNPALDFTAEATMITVGQSNATVLGEQKAFNDYMAANFATTATAYNKADTPASQDIRIENLSVRSDAVFAVTGAGVITGTPGDDTIVGSVGDDKIDGLGGNDTIDYRGALKGMNVDLAAGVAQTILPAGALSTSASMLKGENGFTATSLYTFGETLKNTTGALNIKSAGDFLPTGVPDGIGAYVKDANTVRIFVNSEIAATAGTTWQLENGTSLKGARINYFDIDKTTKAVVDAGSAIGTMYNRAGTEVTAASQIDGIGLFRFCSGSLYEANQFGANKGVADRMYFAGEENTNGSMWTLDTATGDFWAIPDMGRGGWENVVQVDTGTTNKVAFLLGDDGPNGMPLYLYTGTKNPAGTFLERNGLVGGQLYVWKADTASVNSPAELASGTAAGSWVAINAKDASKAGTAGYDALGYKNDTTLRTEADTLGAFSFSRPEDLSLNPLNGTQVAFNSTGAAIVAGNTADGVADGTDIWSTVYKMDLNFSNIGAPTGTLSVIYNSNTDPTHAVRSADNIDWADDGFLYINEDRSTTWAGGANPNEASILKVNPVTGAVTRVAQIDRTAVPAGQTDSSPADFGNWETSGILDVSTLFGQPGGSLFLTDVQAHSINLGPASVVEGGQIVMLAKPAIDATPAETDSLKNIENIIGSNFNDTLTGDAKDNVIAGGLGDDKLIGGAGNDRLVGGSGNDTVDYSGVAGSILVALGNVIAGSTSSYSTGSGGNDIIVDVENVIGGSGKDYIAGNDQDNVLAGGLDDDFILGGLGNDTLNGGGGNDVLAGQGGTNMMLGGAGADIYYVQGVNDQVIEAAGEGFDTIYAFASFSLAATSEIEYIDGQLASGATITGSNTAQVIIGSSGDDTIDGSGGDDVIIALAGNDTLLGGSGNDYLYGISGNDTLTGNAGDDVLISGTGTSVLTGGAGNDTYYLGGLNDVVNEIAGEGYDWINASADVSLSATSEIERIDVSGAVGRSIKGSDTAQLIIGGAGADRIDSAGGVDLVYGGGGADTFVLSNAQSGLDIYEDFVSGTDFLEVSAAAFGGGLAAGSLVAGQFTSNATGNFSNATERFVYCTANHQLVFDADGNGGAKASVVVGIFDVGAPAIGDFKIV